MVTAKDRILNLWLNFAVFLYGLVGIVSILPGFGGAFWGFIAGAFKSLVGLLMLGAAVSFPIICIGSSLGIWLLKNRRPTIAFYVSWLPLFSLALVFAVFSWGDIASRSPLLQREQDHESQLAECALPVFDGGDGLDTTGCGVLEVSAVAAGVTKSTSEAHNWQFSTESTQVNITIENNGSCPQIRVLDSGGRVIESFEERNNTSLCPSGMITTSFFDLSLPAYGTYTLRLITPETPGAYWIKIR